MIIKEKEEKIIKRQVVALTKEESNILQKASRIILKLDKNMSTFYKLNKNNRLFFSNEDYHTLVNLFANCEDFNWNLFNIEENKDKKY